MRIVTEVDLEGKFTYGISTKSLSLCLIEILYDAKYYFQILIKLIALVLASRKIEQV